jgi:hypothetical protein
LTKIAIITLKPFSRNVYNYEPCRSAWSRPGPRSRRSRAASRCRWRLKLKRQQRRKRQHRRKQQQALAQSGTREKTGTKFRSKTLRKLGDLIFLNNYNNSGLRVLSAPRFKVYTTRCIAVLFLVYRVTWGDFSTFRTVYLGQSPTYILEHCIPHIWATLFRGQF